MVEDVERGPLTAPVAPAPRTIRLFGLDIDDLTQNGLVDRVGEAIRERGSCWVVTVNVNLVCRAERDPEFRALIQRANVLTADGMPIVWMSRLRGRPLQARVTGSDLLPLLAVRAAEQRWRLFLCGGAPGIAERVAERLAEIAPGVQVVGTASPEFASEAFVTEPSVNQALLQAIRAAEPDVLIVAFGSPKQERWIRHHFDTGARAVPVAIGVGGSLDFLAGAQRRAPPWMRRSGLEWIHRALTQPARLGPRYARDAFTFARVAGREVLGRDATRAPP
jgi:N-acetylglucosaminyldiphosphoundecaprenol N-acetyl-beta-D-mannosaminyltransferase